MRDSYCKLHLSDVYLKVKSKGGWGLFVCVCSVLAFVFLATSLTFLALWREEWQLAERPLQFQGGSPLSATFQLHGQLWGGKIFSLQIILSIFMKDGSSLDSKSWEKRSAPLEGWSFSLVRLFAWEWFLSVLEQTGWIPGLCTLQGLNAHIAYPSFTNQHDTFLCWQTVPKQTQSIHLISGSVGCVWQALYILLHNTVQQFAVLNVRVGPTKS